MNVEFDEVGDFLYIRLIGELDHHSYKTEKNRIEMKLSTNTKKGIVFDLNGLSFMDSSAISLIYNAYKVAENFNQRVIVVGENEKFIKILTLSGMDEFVEIIEEKECFQ